MSQKEKPYSKAEFYYQLPCVHTTVTKALVLKNITTACEIEILGAVFRKTSETGGSVPVKIEVYELATNTTGGTLYSDIPSPVERDNNETTGYQTFENPTYTLVGAKPMFREFGLCERPNPNRILGYELGYTLKPNAEILILSTVTNGSDFNVETKITGKWRKL